MRGSPLLRTLIVLSVLLLAGAGLLRLTASGPVATAVVRPEPDPPDARLVRGSFELTLSATAREVILESAGSRFTAGQGSELLVGELEIDPAQPLIFLTVKWAGDFPGHRFAELRIDQPGKPTRGHIFKSTGDIDDIWEPEP